MSDNPSYSECLALFQKYRLELTEEQYRKLSRYADFILAEKKHQNITAINDRREIWVRHFLDSAYISCYMPESGKIIDIGTGGGIPGIPIAILNPDYEVTLLDSEANKIRFCQHVVMELGLNCLPIPSRAEELGRVKLYREQYDVAVSRAMATGSMLVELLLPFVKMGGMFVGMKGKNFEEERPSIINASKILGGKAPDVMEYQLEGETKHLVLIDKDIPTSPKYPRRFSRIKKNPL